MGILDVFNEFKAQVKALPEFVSVLSKRANTPMPRENQNTIRSTVGRLGEAGILGPLPRAASTVTKMFPSTTQPISQFAIGASVIPVERAATGGRLPVDNVGKIARTAGGISTGLLLGGPKLVGRAALTGGALGAGATAVSNAVRRRPLAEGIVGGATEGARFGAETSPTFLLTGAVVDKLARSIPALRAISDSGIRKTLPQGSQTISQVLKSIRTTGLKRIVKAALIETPVEGIVYGVKNQGEKEKLLDSVANEMVENFVFNLGFAATTTVWDSKTIFPVLKKSLEQAMKNNPNIKLPSVEDIPIGLQAKDIGKQLLEGATARQSELLSQAQQKTIKVTDIGELQTFLRGKGFEFQQGKIVPMVGAEQQAKTEGRTPEQVELERAYASKDFTKARDVINKMSATDEYKASALADVTRLEGGAPAQKPLLEQLYEAQQKGDLKAEQRITDELRTEATKDIVDPVQKVITALKGARPIRGQQEALYRAERSKRAGAVAAVGERMEGERGFFSQLSQLKGELPKAEFEGIRKQIQQQDIDSLFNNIEASNLSPFEKITAKTGLAKLLGSEGGIVPNKSELALLNSVFPPEFTQAVLDKRSTVQKLFNVGEEALNLPRSIMATADLSAPLRQGVFLIGRPKQWIPAFGNMFKYAFNEKAYEGLQKDIASRPNYKLMRENKLALTDMKNPDLMGREEAFVSTLAEKIPGFGKIAKGSNRAYTGFLNKLRADTFDSILDGAKKQGVDIDENPKVVEDIAKFVNAATGRGNLGALQKYSGALSTALFSPRLMASRLNLLNPVFYAKLEPSVRKEALKSLFTFASTALTVTTLAKLAGAEVGDDPRSADFMKIKVGNTRYDVMGGFQQYLVAATRLLTGQMVSSTTGREFTLGEGYKPTTRKDILVRFFESKESPVASFITSLLEGKTAVGEDVKLSTEVADRFIPMVWQDMFDLARDKENPLAMALALPALFGVGVQTYGNQVPMSAKTATGRETIKWRQQPSLGESIINKFTGTQISDFPEDQQKTLAEERLTELKRDAELDKAKRLVLETGEEMVVGDTIVYLDNGIVKTRKGGDITDLFKTGSAKDIYLTLKGLSKEEANAQLDKIEEENPSLFSRIEQEAIDDNLKITDEERKMRNLGVRNEERVKAIISALNNLTTTEEKNALLDRYEELRILTESVSSQLEEMREKGEI